MAHNKNYEFRYQISHVLNIESMRSKNWINIAEVLKIIK